MNLVIFTNTYFFLHILAETVTNSMQVLPNYQNLQIKYLSASFTETTNSYKFYWLWSILDVINERNSLVISTDELAIRMISLAWYPLDFYKISFGNQDSFKPLAKSISSRITIDCKSNSKDLYLQLESHPDKTLVNNIKKEVKTLLNRWVAFRFIRPFFNSELKNIPDQKVNLMIKEFANSRKGFAPYHFEDEYIIIDPLWQNYFSIHQNILRGFLKWHLLKFLQKNNPSVIGLSEKLEKPIKRDLLAARKYWTSYLKFNPTNCIYKNNALNHNKISLDHFIPWSYVVHDQLWNIIPTTKSTNSLKSNSLPKMELYFNRFCDLQYKAMIYHLERGNSDLITDYYSLTNCNDLSTISYSNFKDKLQFEISNNIRTAQNLGFTSYFNL